MKKTIKYIIWGAGTLYLIICVACSMSFNWFLGNLMPVENLIHTEQINTVYGNDIFSIYFDEKNIVFKQITHVDITPFELVKIPQIACQYSYNIMAPDSTTHQEKGQKINVIDFLNNGSLLAKIYCVDKHGFAPLFFGFGTNDFTLTGLSNYVFNYKTEKGYIFAFYRSKNPNFDESIYKVSY